MTLSESLLTVAGRYSEHTDRSLARIATLAANDGKFFSRLAAGRDVTTRRYEAVMLWLSERWPDDLDWPAEVERPRTEEAA